MIVALIDVGFTPSAATRILASALERRSQHLYIHVLDLNLQTLGQYWTPDKGFCQELEYIIGMIHELDAEIVGLSCSFLNIDTVLSLCQRIHSIHPNLGVVLWGPEAAARDRRGPPDRDRKRGPGTTYSRRGAVA